MSLLSAKLTGVQCTSCALNIITCDATSQRDMSVAGRNLPVVLGLNFRTIDKRKVSRNWFICLNSITKNSTVLGEHFFLNCFAKRVTADVVVELSLPTPGSRIW